MGASILLVGGDRLWTFLSTFIHQFTAHSLERATDALEALQLIQAQQPDVLLLQANYSGSFDLCHQIKSTPRLAWIYCILLNDAELDAIALANHEAEALEMGADAYISLPPTLPLSPSAQPSPLPPALRRLQAQLQAGIRQVETHRELIRSNDLLSAIALSDPLTELNNRRALAVELPRQLQAARERQQPLSLVMLDVDFFKRINDTYGHLVGDRVLALVSARLRHNLRFYDTPFRYGGEEFLLILNNTDNEEADMIAKRICELVRERPFAIDDTLMLPVTISAGTATLLPEDDDDGTSLLNRADQRLLMAKALGRDRVVSCPC